MRFALALQTRRLDLRKIMVNQTFTKFPSHIGTVNDYFLNLACVRRGIAEQKASIADKSLRTSTNSFLFIFFHQLIYPVKVWDNSTVIFNLLICFTSEHTVCYMCVPKLIFSLINSILNFVLF